MCVLFKIFCKTRARGGTAVRLARAYGQNYDLTRNKRKIMQNFWRRGTRTKKKEHSSTIIRIPIFYEPARARLTVSEGESANLLDRV